MENASKALIIAGAILLAILLISLGILIFNQAQDTVNNSGMSQAEITAFNNKFLKYEGKQSGTVVKSLVNEVIASNADGNNSTRPVKINGYLPTEGNGSITAKRKPSDFDTNTSYTVTLNYDDGIVTNINIEQPSQTPTP